MLVVDEGIITLQPALLLLLLVAVVARWLYEDPIGVVDTEENAVTEYRARKA